MLVIQAVLIGILTSVSSHIAATYGFTFGWYTLGRPLIGGFICGIIFGDITRGVLLGAAIQTVYLAYVTPGGAIPVDISFVSYPAMAIALVSNMETSMAIAMASTIGVIGTIAFNLTKGANSFWNSKTRTAIEEKQFDRLTRYHLILPQLTMLLIRGIPAFLAVYVGAEYVTQCIEMLPEFVTNALMSLGGILPAVGIAALLTQCAKEASAVLFFLMGFVCVVFMNMNIIGVSIVGGVFAYFYYLISAREMIPSSVVNVMKHSDLEEEL